MFLNTISPAEGSRKASRRVGRGIGSTTGKTSGKGHKGQKARAGGFHKVGFEGGQMPLQRRLPKVGFLSRKKARVAQIRLGELNRISDRPIDLDLLKALKLAPTQATEAKVVDSGELSVAVTLIRIRVTQSARQKIEALGGKVEV